MKNIILVISLALSAVAVSLSYSIKDENNMSELVEDNIEALNLEEEEIEGCIEERGGKCLVLYVESSGGSGVQEHKDYINYMEVLDE
jgi:hypothetical protein